MKGRPEPSRLGPDACLPALEALRFMRDEYGLPVLGKPCVAYVLDGNLGAAGRHTAAFVIALECRELNLSEKDTEKVLIRWARKVRYSQRQALRPITNAYRKKPDGHWLYHAPGVNKKPGTAAYEVLSGTCADVGCPANCPAFAGVHRGPNGEGYERFERVGWPAALRKTRHGAAIDVYRAICLLERDRGFAHGSLLHTSYRQLATIAGRDVRHIGHNLDVLHSVGLLALFERGSGSGPNARDRQASRVQRRVPIPAITTPAITTGGGPPSQIGGRTP